MPAIKKLASLFETISANDWTGAEAAASEIIRAEEQMKHHSAAQLLRGALRPNARNGNHHPTQAATPMLAGALSRQTSTARLSDMMLSAQAKTELHEIVKEWKHRARLESLGIKRRSRLFFHGPPGCGKSMTASALGNELGIPTFLVRFDAIIGAYLGQTAIHLRQLFNFTETTPSVLLIDEVDALAKQRGNALDVGELDRIVISLMQELEHSHPKGFVIATSNLAKNIDEALWRRFDLSLEYRKPRQAELKKYAAQLVRGLGVRIPKKSLRGIHRAASYAEVRSMIEGAARRSVLASL